MSTKINYLKLLKNSPQNDKIPNDQLAISVWNCYKNTDNSTDSQKLYCTVTLFSIDLYCFLSHHCQYPQDVVY